MYCPNCGGSTTAGLRFCKACGTNVEVVSHALSGHLVAPAQPPVQPFDFSQYSNLSVGAYKGIGMGAVFLLGALFFAFTARGGMVWGAFGLLVAGGAMFSKGFAQLVTARKLEQLSAPKVSQTAYAPPQMPPYISTQPLSPGSNVTEQTTRHLDSVRRE